MNGLSEMSNTMPLLENITRSTTPQFVNNSHSSNVIIPNQDDSKNHE